MERYTCGCWESGVTEQGVFMNSVAFYCNQPDCKRPASEAAPLRFWGEGD